jgi:Uncharacterised nucleotidyltransferase
MTSGRMPEPTSARAGHAAQLAPLHQQLLLVALMPPDRAVEHWKELRRGLDVDGITNRRTIKLLPLVWRNLVDAGIDDPQLPSLEATVVRTRSQNDRLFEHLASALDILAGAGVRSLALKGAPLAVLYYRDPGLRPMVDVDLLVDPRDAPGVTSALDHSGWCAADDLPPDFLTRGGETSYCPPGGSPVLDLHFRLLPWVTRSGPGSDPALWAGAAPFEVGGRSTLAPAPHDLVLHVILHAYRSSWSRVPRWVPDVTLLLRREGDRFDWGSFLNRVVASHLVLPVRDALRYLVDVFEAPVPVDVRAALQSTSPSRRELHKHRIASSTMPERHWLLGQWPALRTYWCRTSINFTRVGALWSFPAFVRWKMDVDRLRRLPFVVARRRLRTRASRGSSRG